MTRSLLAWRHAVRADRAALSQFICTDPPKNVYTGGRKQHPRPWELDVQSGLRAQKPPYTGDTVMLLGHQPNRTIGAVTLTTFQQRHFVTVRALAVAQALRHRGGAHAQEAMETVLGMIRSTRDADGRPYLLVQAYIHPQNAASKSLCGRNGFEYVDMHRDDLEFWAQPLV